MWKSKSLKKNKKRIKDLQNSNKSTGLSKFAHNKMGFG